MIAMEKLIVKTHIAFQNLIVNGHLYILRILNWGTQKLIQDANLQALFI